MNSASIYSPYRIYRFKNPAETQTRETTCAEGQRQPSNWCAQNSNRSPSIQPFLLQQKANLRDSFGGVHSQHWPVTKALTGAASALLLGPGFLVPVVSVTRGAP